MRSSRRCTRVWIVFALAPVTAPPQHARATPLEPTAQPPASQPAVDGESAEVLARVRAHMAAGRPDDAERILSPAIGRFPDRADLRLAWIDVALAQGRAATALERVQAVGPSLYDRPEFQFRAAQAYYRGGILLGEVEMRTVPGGRPGQFAGERLLLEPRPGPDRYLCCPKASALYQIRQALDGGLDEPAAHVLHARIWQQLGRPQVGLAILRNRAAVLLPNADDSVLAAFSDLALEAGALSEFLRYSWLRAERQPARRASVLLEACLKAAERCNQGGEETLYAEWLHRAAHFRPNDPDLLLRQADAEWALERFEPARRLYARVLQLAPGHPQRGRILARLADNGGATPAP